MTTHSTTKTYTTSNLIHSPFLSARVPQRDGIMGHPEAHFPDQWYYSSLRGLFQARIPNYSAVRERSSTLSHGQGIARLTVTAGAPVHNSVRPHFERFKVRLYLKSTSRESQIYKGWCGNHAITQLSAGNKGSKYRLNILLQITSSPARVNTHMRVHSSRRFIENSIKNYAFQQEPWHKRRNWPNSRERSSLDDVAYEVSHHRVWSFHATSSL